MYQTFTPQTFFDLSLFAHKELFLEITHVWDALDKIPKYINSQALGVIQGDVSAAAHLIDPDLISIGVGSVVEPGAYIKGPCIIGDYCTVRHGAYLRGNVVAGDHCVLGHDTEVKNSIFLDHAKAAHFSYVGDSILGNHANLGAGVKLANLLFNRTAIKIDFQEGKVSTGRKKLGAILGDFAQIGCNSVTNPGTLMGKKSCLYPCLNVGGIILEGYTVRGSHEIISYPKKSYALSERG